MKFDSYHPTINLIFFVAVITASIYFNQPVFLAISYLTSFSYSVKLNGIRALVFNIILIPLAALFTLYYASYTHFGVTNLAANFIGNEITLESLVFGATLGIRMAAVLMWFSCVHAIVSSDKVIYLFGRVSPKISLFLSILLRTVPRVKAQACRILTAQRCIGRGVRQGNILRRLHNLFRVVSIVITWMIENFVESSDSMRSRGYALKGRTAFSIYRFDNRDRTFVIALFLFLTIILMGILLDQTRIFYDPAILLNTITPLSYVFYVAYAALSFAPMTLQVVGEVRFKVDDMPRTQANRWIK